MVAWVEGKLEKLRLLLLGVLRVSFVGLGRFWGWFVVAASCRPCVDTVGTRLRVEKGS